MGILFLERLVPAWFQSRAAATHGLTLDILKGLVDAERCGNSYLSYARTEIQAKLHVLTFCDDPCTIKIHNMPSKLPEQNNPCCFCKTWGWQDEYFEHADWCHFAISWQSLLGWLWRSEGAVEGHCLPLWIWILRSPESVPWVFCSNSV